MYYTRYYEVSDIERLMKVSMIGAYARVNNGAETLIEKFISFMMYASAYSLAIVDTGCWMG